MDSVYVEACNPVGEECFNPVENIGGYIHIGHSSKQYVVGDIVICIREVESKDRYDFAALCFIPNEVFNAKRPPVVDLSLP